MTDVPAPSVFEPSQLPEVVLAGVRLHAITEAECVAHVVESLEVNRGGWIATANLDHVRRLRRAEEFRRAYAGASVVVADGMPLIWASRLQGSPLPERVAGSDLIHSLTAGAAAGGRSVFFLGGDPGSADAAAARLVKDHPELRVAGTYCPPMGFEKDPAQMEELRRAVQENSPDIVFVALGSPKQELLIYEIRALLPQAWWIGVGISFSFVCGAVRRAPKWVQGMGLEWFHRLLQEPRRLATRYLLHGPPCLLWLLFNALRGRLTNRRRRDAML
ncbi:MAG: N-acetylglucosaminyldiphosphoundecaprenol N-acetyl-beta-D-mannosaminyltransferase [Planctomycetota bacterium]|jgi:N-acetylglucosaminyldiphosphoundecaprenol N-acetyl-beta-D-mannosaminyltransferase